MLDELKKFIKFNIVGVVNTLLDLVVYTALSAWGLRIEAAQGISYALGMVNSYLLNSRWTFKDKRDSAKRVVLFVLVNLASYGVSVAVLYFVRGQWGLEGLVAKLIALPFSTAVNFIGNRLLVFKKNDSEGKQ